VNSRPFDENRLVTPAEAAEILGVDQGTMARWAAAGRITAIRLERGPPRYREGEVRALKATIPQQRRPAE
jgi:excisionase family DNA binding protein